MVKFAIRTGCLLFCGAILGGIMLSSANLFSQSDSRFQSKEFFTGSLTQRASGSALFDASTEPAGNSEDGTKSFEQLKSMLPKVYRDTGNEIGKDVSGESWRYDFEIETVIARQTSSNTAKIGYQCVRRYTKLSKYAMDVRPVSKTRNSLYLRFFEGKWTVERVAVAHSRDSDFADIQVALSQRIDLLGEE